MPAPKWHTSYITRENKKVNLEERKEKDKEKQARTRTQGANLREYQNVYYKWCR